MCQSASAIPAVKVFFANVSAFSNFNSLSSKRKDLFHSHGVEIPQPGDTRWYYRSRTVSFLSNKYKDILELLDIILENPQGWYDATLTQASGSLHYLNSFLFCFLIKVFNKILEQSSTLYMFLRNKNTDFSYGVQKISNFLDFLCTLRNDEEYNCLYASTVEKIGQPSFRSDLKYNFKQLFFEIIYNTKVMMEERFADCKKFSFLDLVNPKLFPQWKDKVPSDMLFSLKNAYGPLFDLQVPESQLLFLYKHKDLYKESPTEKLEYIFKHHLEHSLPEVVKLLKLYSVVAISSASVERSFSCMKIVETYLWNTMGQERLGSLCEI